MRLYHAGPAKIQKPDIRFGRKNADFGQGFYLTPDRDFAYRWAREGSVLNEYELDLTGLEVCRLERNADWADYIFYNRRADDRICSDVIIGPIANDTIYDTFGVISSGFFGPEERLRLLKIGPEYIQIAVKSERAAAQLHWLNAEPVQNIEYYQILRREEEKAYQTLLSKALQEQTE